MAHAVPLQEGHPKMGERQARRFPRRQQQARHQWTSQIQALQCTNKQAKLEWTHSWKHLSILDTSTKKYLAWLALGHLEGSGRIYINQQHFRARPFEDEFQSTYATMMSRKTTGSKRKGKNANGGEEVLTPGDFLKAVGLGLGNEGKGSYVKLATSALRTKAPVTFEVRRISQHELHTKYEEHLNRIAKRILQPELVL